MFKFYCSVVLALKLENTFLIFDTKSGKKISQQGEEG